jgi:ABC-2 type transport system permease protein
MTHLYPLMQREWLQHRFGWTLMAVLPTALALLVMSFGHLEFEADVAGPKGAALVALASLGGAIGLTMLMFGLTSLIIVSGIARRDHADRSVEFWLSLPTGHAESLAVPLLVHLILVPLAALAVGLVSGLLVSLVLVLRLAGFGEWLSLPWGALLPGALAIAGRLALGLVLAMLWLSPLILATVLLTAWFRRWGIVILAVGIGLGSVIMDRIFGQPILFQLLSEILSQAGKALVNSGGADLDADKPESIQTVLGLIPSWAVADAGTALKLALSPLFAGGLAVAAACFAGLVQWRQRGASAAG